MVSNGGGGDIMEKNINELRIIVEKAKENGNWYRLGRVFHTTKCFYFLDTGTGKVYKISKNTYRVLDCLFKTNNFDNLYKINISKQELYLALREICDAIKGQHLFSAPPLSKQNIIDRHLNLEKHLQNEMNSITLELTEKCNLRCKYCVYGKTNENYRTFGEKVMSLETARKGIDFLMEHSKEDEKVYIGFYGGEPLLRFPIIKEIILYIRSNYSHRKVFYSMTSNMTLMTDEIAKFLANVEDMSVVASIDGPKEIHDNQRVFIDGRGTFEKAIKGLETYMRYKKASVNKDKPFAISTVLMEPYDKKKFDTLNDFFGELRKKYSFSILISYVSHTSPSVEYVEINDRDENKWSNNEEPEKIYDPLMAWTMNNLNEDVFTNNYFRRAGLIEIHMRNISDLPIETYSLNGCCVPGSRRLYVTSDGEFLPCERIGTQLPIGNVNSGFDIDFIRKNYVEDFIEQEIRFCGECWAINMCKNCYMNCFGDNVIDFSHRHIMCENSRKRLTEALSIYHEILEKRPEFIEQLNDVIIE